MSRQPMSITSNRTEVTAYCSGISATGRASVTDITASKPETKTTPLSTSTESKPHLLALQFRQAQGCTYGAGLGLGQPAGGRSKSLKTEQHKTVGPSRVKKREFARAPVIWDPDRDILAVNEILCRKQKTQIFRAFPYAAVGNCGGRIHTEFRYKMHCKTANLRQKAIELAHF